MVLLTLLNLRLEHNIRFEIKKRNRKCTNLFLINIFPEEVKGKRGRRREKVRDLYNPSK